jgi:hypothetical protein
VLGWKIVFSLVLFFAMTQSLELPSPEEYDVVVLDIEVLYHLSLSSLYLLSLFSLSLLSISLSLSL